MPAETSADHTHVYTSYLMCLTRKCWAYQGTSRNFAEHSLSMLPGRNHEERALVASALQRKQYASDPVEACEGKSC